METGTASLCDVIREDNRAGDADDCELLTSEKKNPSSTSGSSSLGSANVTPVPGGIYVASSQGSSLFFWTREKSEDGVFTALDGSPFVKLYRHIRIDALYATSGDPIVFALPTEQNRVGFFLAAGHLPSQRSILLLDCGSTLEFVPHQCVKGRAGDLQTLAEPANVLSSHLEELRTRQKSKSPRPSLVSLMHPSQAVLGSQVSSSSYSRPSTRTRTSFRMVWMAVITQAIVWSPRMIARRETRVMAIRLSPRAPRRPSAAGRRSQMDLQTWLFQSTRAAYTTRHCMKRWETH